MKIPKGFIKDSEGIYRRGNFVFKENKIFRESAIVPKDTVEKLKDNYATKLDCIRAALAFPAIIGEEPRTTNVYIDKAGKGFKVADKFSKNTVAVVMPDRNVMDIQATDISDSTDFKDLVNKDKKDLPVTAKSLKTFSSGKPIDSQKGLTESAEGVQEFWDKFDKGEIKIGDTFANGVKLLDANKKADYIVVDRGHEFVAAWAPELSGEDLVWGQGHYFDTEEDAREYFNSKLNESEKLNESTRFYCTEEPDAYLDIQNLKTIKNSAGKVLDVNTHGLVQNGDTVYVVTSDSDLDTVKVYSVDYQFPYVFKAGKKEEGGNE